MSRRKYHGNGPEQLSGMEAVGAVSAAVGNMIGALIMMGIVAFLLFNAARVLIS